VPFFPHCPRSSREPVRNTRPHHACPSTNKKIPSVNDAATVPDSSYAHGSYHWSFERLISAGLIPLTIAPFAAGSLNPVMDGLFISTILIHSHIGFQSCIIDYFPTKRVPKTRKFSMWALNAATILAGIGFYEFETNDVGLTEGVKRIWQAKKPVVEI
jgi:succinate dehydrogenase (ubiquinone) membrane anchor subunit